MKKTERKIVLAGGSGFLGRILARWYIGEGHKVVVLSRSPTAVSSLPGLTFCRWDGRNLGQWVKEMEGATALINLAGRSVNCRYTEKNREQMMGSRVQSTMVLGEALQKLSRPPAVWLNSSTATIYRHTYGIPQSESGETGSHPDAKDAFSVEVARTWESAFETAEVPPGLRKVTLRTAMVFGKEPGGVFDVLRRLARFRLGGKMGRGHQFVSWIHVEDFCRAMDWLVRNSNAAGIYNIAAPQPVTNTEMMAILRRAVGVRIGLPAPGWLLELGAFFLRTETELIIKSRRVVPERLLTEGFDFTFPDMPSAVAALEGDSGGLR